MTESKRYSIPYGSSELVLETGHVAQQAAGAVWARWGETVVLAACVVSDERADFGFFPLTVDYREKFYASGRIPGGFYKREGRPGTSETIRARLIDRPIRPLFPKGFSNETQIYVTVLSMDQEHPADLPALIASSAALYISKIPFNTPISACRVAHIDGEFVINPTFPEIEQSDLDLVTAGTKDALCMVECASNIVPEDVLLEALKKAHEENQRVVQTLDRMREECGVPEMEYDADEVEPELRKEVEEKFRPRLTEIHEVVDKQERSKVQRAIVDEIIEQLDEKYPESGGHIAEVAEEIYSTDMRRRIIEEKTRPDGRSRTEIRPISCMLDLLPCTHGSAIFTRGQTQVLAALTLGTPEDRQTIDDILGVTEKAFMLHYNFPSYSVGECRRPSGPGRREIGHGMLAEKSIYPVLPENEEFPYTVRIVSEVLESNGSSSMATVCAGCLALMEGGVPISAPVAGIAMGLVQEGDEVAILSDILGLEDHLGDMDFKVAGTTEGVTALQMDIKMKGIDFDILKKALAQAKEGREFILGKMAEALEGPREDLKPHAPRIKILHIPVDKIGELIGPGGKHIKNIIEVSGCKVDIEDDGSVYIASNEGPAMQKAVDMIRARTAEPEVGEMYTGKVVRVTNFGAFVEILPGKDGLVHISELDFGRVGKVEDVCREGDTITVKVIGVDPVNGKIRLSRKEAMADKQGKGGGRKPQANRKTQPSHGRAKHEGEGKDQSDKVYRWVPSDKKKNEEE